jgi:hypothetical protein
MPRHEFDQWRRENDLPALLAFFKQVLPHFNEWQSANGITDEVFLMATQPSKFFIGNSRLFLACSTVAAMSLNAVRQRRFGGGGRQWRFRTVLERC